MAGPTPSLTRDQDEVPGIDLEAHPFAHGLAAAKDIGVSREERNLPGLTP